MDMNDKKEKALQRVKTNMLFQNIAYYKCENDLNSGIYSKKNFDDFETSTDHLVISLNNYFSEILNPTIS